MSPSIRFSLECFAFWACFVIAALAKMIPTTLAFAVTVSVVLMWVLHHRGVIEEASGQGLDSPTEVFGAMGVRPSESFSFSIEPNGHGAFSLYFHAKSAGSNSMALIGQWATLEQAQKVAARIQHRVSDVANASVPTVAAQTPQSSGMIRVAQ